VNRDDVPQVAEPVNVLNEIKAGMKLKKVNRDDVPQVAEPVNVLNEIKAGMKLKKVDRAPRPQVVRKFGNQTDKTNLMAEQQAEQQVREERARIDREFIDNRNKLLNAGKDLDDEPSDISNISGFTP